MTKHIKRHSIVPAIQLLPAHCSTFYCSTKYHSTLSAHSPEFPVSSEKIPASWKFNSTQIRVCVCAPCLASLTPTSLLPFRLHHHPTSTSSLTSAALLKLIPLYEFMVKTMCLPLSKNSLYTFGSSDGFRNES